MKENLEERIDAQNSGGEKFVKGAHLSVRILRGHFFLTGFVTVTLDGLSEREDTCSLVQKGLQ